MNRERVQMLRDMMEGVPKKQVELRKYYKANGEPCNTIACIAGWAAIYPPFVEQGLRVGRDPDFPEIKTVVYEDKYGEDAAAKFFDVPFLTFFMRLDGEVGGDKEIALARLDKLLAQNK